jgi:hypothetical protein
MTVLIYTSQRSKKTKKQRAAESALLKEQRAIKKDLEQMQKKSTRHFMGNTLHSSRNTKHIPSLDSGIGTTSLAPSKVYTGDAIIGIATMHKSNAVPVFKKQDAEDISNMRR